MKPSAIIGPLVQLALGILDAVRGRRSRKSRLAPRVDVKPIGEELKAEAGPKGNVTIITLKGERIEL